MSEEKPPRIVPVILSGGSGTRLWPLSRLDRLKPMVDLTGEGTLLELTARRVADAALFLPPVLVTGEEDSAAAAGQLAASGMAAALTVVEPAARGTASAVALAALTLDEDALMLVLPSDHVITDENAFRLAIESARGAALEGWLVTFGIAPDRPETGYGYIKRGARIADGAYRAERFAEKPDAATATRWLAEGGYDWNAGIFLMRAGDYLAALAVEAPVLAAAARAAVAGGRREGSQLLPQAAALAAAPSSSIDRAVMERWDRVAVIPVAMGWSDVGSWEAVYALGPHDAQGNAVAGDAVAVDSRGCLVRTDGPVVVALGVEDLVIIATERAVLVVPRGDTQRVGQAIEALEKRRERGTDNG
jgi:mannose-1-phosphate guanylyltransferase